MVFDMQLHRCNQSTMKTLDKPLNSDGLRFHVSPFTGTVKFMNDNFPYFSRLKSDISANFFVTSSAIAKIMRIGSEGDFTI